MNTKTNFCRTAFCLILLVAGFSSCKKDDKKSTEVSMANIAGTYKFTEMTYQYNNDPVENILQDLDVQLIRLDTRHESGKHIGLIFLANVDA